MTCEKKMELSSEVCTSKFTSAEKAVGNLLLIGLLHVVRALQWQKVSISFLEKCFISRTSKLPAQQHVSGWKIMESQNGLGLKGP